MDLLGEHEAPDHHQALLQDRDDEGVALLSDRRWRLHLAADRHALDLGAAVVEHGLDGLRFLRRRDSDAHPPADAAAAQDARHLLMQRKAAEFGGRIRLLHARSSEGPG